MASSQSECASLLARGDIEFIDAVLNFDANGVPYASAGDMFVQVKGLDEDSNVISCLQYGGFDLETPECGIAGKWPAEWGTDSGTYRYTANVSKVGAAGENWLVCVGNGWTQAGGAVAYSGQLMFPPTLTYAIPLTSSPTLLPSVSPTQTTTTTNSPSRTPSLAPSPLPTVTLSPTSDPIHLQSDCGDSLVIDFDAQLSGGQSVCVDFGANGSFSSFALLMNFSGSVTGEKASDFGMVLYSTHYHVGVQYGGYNYYLDGINYVIGWPESWNSRDPGSYSVAQSVNINPPFDVDGDYYRLCIFNGWSSAERVTYSGSIDLSNSLTLNCDVVPPDLTPTVSPTPQPTLTFAPSGLSARGIYPLSSRPLDPLAFQFDVNLSSAAFVCSPPVEATGFLTSLSTVFQFFTENDISWASDLLVTVQMKTGGDDCLVIGGADVNPEQTCAVPKGKYSWPSKSLQSNRDGTYNATVEIAGWTTDPATYEVCLLLSLSSYSLPGLPHQWICLQ